MHKQYVQSVFIREEVSLCSEGKSAMSLHCSCLPPPTYCQRAWAVKINLCHSFSSVIKKERKEKKKAISSLYFPQYKVMKCSWPKHLIHNVQHLSKLQSFSSLLPAGFYGAFSGCTFHRFYLIASYRKGALKRFPSHLHLLQGGGEDVLLSSSAAVSKWQS